MVRTALEFIRKELEAFIVSREDDPAHYSVPNVVDLQAMAAANGTVNLDDSTHITMMLVGVDEERREGKHPVYLPTDDNGYRKLHPPVEINFFLLFAAHHSDYPTALRDLSDVIAFFQYNSVFYEPKFPQLNASVTEPQRFPWRRIERLSFTIHNLSFEQQNNLWSMLGVKYLPSIVYKVKLLTVFDVKGEVAPAITELALDENAI